MARSVSELRQMKLEDWQPCQYIFFMNIIKSFRQSNLVTYNDLQSQTESVRLPKAAEQIKGLF